MAFTYAQMKTAIQDYTENTETSFVTNLPVFIRAAEDRIFKLADLEVFRKNATSALTQNDQYLSVPTDYLASFSMSITNSSSKEFLLQKDVNFLHEFHPNASTTGTPKMLRNCLPCHYPNAIANASELSVKPWMTLLASLKIIFSAGSVQKIVRVPADQLTALSLLELCRIVVRANVVPDDVYVPIPTSKSVPSEQA